MLFNFLILQTKEMRQRGEVTSLDVDSIRTGIRTQTIRSLVKWRFAYPQLVRFFHGSEF